MIRGKLIAVVALAGLLGALAGCGGDPKPGDPPNPNPAPNPQPNGQPGPNAQGDGHQLDPDKHTIPNAPATGRLAGKPFTPDQVEIMGNRLEFRQGKDLFPDASVTIFLGDNKPFAEGVKLVVRPGQKLLDGIPTLHVATRKGADLPKTDFINEGYALALEVGKVEKGKSSGKIYLGLPGAENSYLSGTFVAERKRSSSDLPGAEEVPFIQGVVSPPMKKGQFVSVGYIGVPTDGKLIIDDASGSVLGDDGSGLGARSTTYAPRTANIRLEKFTPKFNFTNLPPGRYFIVARVKDGPVAWKWVDLPADGKVNADLKLDEKNVGTVEVKLPPDQKEASLVPTDLGSPPPDDRFIDLFAFPLGLRAEAKDGKATVANVPAGKYQVRAGALRADVEVTAGKTATVELKPAKK